MKNLTLLFLLLGVIAVSCEKKEDDSNPSTEKATSFKLVMTDPIADPSSNQLSTLTKEYTWETSDVKVVNQNNELKSLVAFNASKNAAYTTYDINMSEDIQSNYKTTLLMGKDGISLHNFLKSKFVVFERDEDAGTISGTINHMYVKYLNIGTTTRTASYTGIINIKFDNVKY